MSGNKTVPGNDSVEAFINDLPNEQLVADSRKLLNIMREISGKPAVMWGTMIGFGNFHYKYTSGREGDWFEIGFSPRKSGVISLYVTFDAEKLTAQFPGLGKYKTGKGCIYINKLADVNIHELKKLITTAYSRGWENPDRPDGKEQLAA